MHRNTKAVRGGEMLMETCYFLLTDLKKKYLITHPKVSYAIFGTSDIPTEFWVSHERKLF